MAQPVAAQVIFDNGPGNNRTYRGAQNSPGQGFTASANTTITQFGLYVGTAGDVFNYFIYDGSHSSILYQAQQTVAASDGSTASLSTPFSFTMLAGQTYYLSMISGSSSADYGYIYPAGNDTQGTLTANAGNTNYSGFVDPGYAGGGGAVIAVQIVGGEVTATPEPASLMLLGTGLLGVVAVRRRKRTLTK
jgi:hypothetical protein